MVRLSPCSSLFSSLCLSNIFIDMTVIIPPMTKHTRLCQNCLPKNIFFSFTRWYPRSFGNKGWTGRRRDGDRVVPVVVARSFSHVNHRDDFKRAKGSISQNRRRKTSFVSAERSGQKWNRGSKADYLYLWKRMDQSQRTFKARKWVLWTVRDFPLWPFNECVKSLKSSVKYLSARGYQRICGKMLHKHSDWVRQITDLPNLAVNSFQRNIP